MGPIYWDPVHDISDVVRGTWFYKDSMLPVEPMPDLFALSLAKAAQRNLVKSLSMTYGPHGVHIGVINVAGFISAEEKETKQEVVEQTQS